MAGSAARQAFAHYLRTGQRLPATAFARMTGIGIKFNPHHDPHDGRFTSAAGGGARTSGVWGGGGFTGGGGGDFGGGGATGHGIWPARPRVIPADPNRRRLPPRGLMLIRPAATSTAAAPTHDVIRNGYTYRLDDADRTVQVTGRLTLGDDGKRSRSAQARAGGRDRLPTDDGGHYIAVRFNGPTEAFNHLAQDANFNRGDYRVLEDRWAAAARQGKKVLVAIKPAYAGRSRRPSEIKVSFTVEGSPNEINFPNQAGRTKHAR